ncbi:uncharacterized protein TRIADDRAFT_37261 [Trichoplax adhaerens]|uniref:Peptide-N-glycosidase F N-terminal domain-containing protein n=1 Tax=Trichoplax adhaerens TaxID=10228 RepID=B3RQD3_TRIAD|nr:hypothetical protein TRIADDRAFT_37261 [Trichoplax adhaerens]EDV28324.1 hypothetical protein TRIADDRAFT_37261 [Trichoplax adhaerens]|eukprot:XP_002110158.1 hypothetical protein TRIADDRAFT_37261 [Trichoplax adhaerens]
MAKPEVPLVFALIIITIAYTQCATFLPGDEAKPFTLRTLSGKIEYINAKNSSHLLPMVLFAYDPRSAYMEAIWTKDSSVKALIMNSTKSGNYVFMSYSDHALQDVQWMQKRVTNQIADLYLSGLGKRMHFVVLPVESMGNWIPLLLSKWTCQDFGCGFQQILVSTDSKFPYVINRLDPRYDWIGSPASAYKSSIQVVELDACKGSSNVSLSGKMAIAQHQKGCSYFKMVKAAYTVKAAGLTVIAAKNEYPVDMNCHGNECNVRYPIPATMISYAEGQKILKLLKSKKKVDFSFQTTPSHNFYFGIDGQGKIEETGWLLYPSFLYFTWQLQWYAYKSNLIHNIAEHAKVVQIFNDSTIHGKYGASAIVNLPPVKEYQDVQLDMALSCRGKRDEECPPWDHTVQLYVCCSNATSHCQQELGRWITSFRRRIGHWLTPVTPLLPLLSSSSCNFTMKTVPWAQPWFTTLKLRFSHKINTTVAKKKGTPLKPQKLIPLFRGGTFDKNYNKKYKPIHFNMTSKTKKVKLVAVITGHGSDNNNCAEFCVTSHHFMVNEKHANVRTFSNAGNSLGCAERVLQGVTPNEHGTWLYGRDGWCDGQEIKPWIVDITNQLSTKSVNTITYHGYYNHTDPHPTSKPGYIIMYSFLSLYDTY